MALTLPGEIGRRAFREGLPVDASTVAPADLRLVWARDPEPSQVMELRADIGERAARMLIGPTSRRLRARIDHVGDTRCVTLRPARYIDESERVAFGTLQLVLRDDLAVVIARGGCFALDRWIETLAGHTQALADGPIGVAHAAIRRVLDDYEPVLAGLENDIDEIEDQVFGAGASPVRRTYELLREVISFQRATDPLVELLSELQRRRAGVHDGTRESAAEHHFDNSLAIDARQTSERAASYRALLENVLNVNLALETKRLSEVAIDQTEQTKKISSWAAILFTPSLVAGVYGMNFRHMPELTWSLGYPFAIVLMLGMMGGLYAIFKARDWL